MAETKDYRTVTGGCNRPNGWQWSAVDLPTCFRSFRSAIFVVFPGTVMPLTLGGTKQNLLDEVMPGEKVIGIVTQKRGNRGYSGYADLDTVGVAGHYPKLFKLPDGNQSIIVTALCQFSLMGSIRTNRLRWGRIESDGRHGCCQGRSLDALVASVRQQANRVIRVSPNTPDEAARF